MGRLTGADGRRRPGRFRRWVLRPLLWGLAAFAVLVFLGQRLLDTSAARERLRVLLERRASAVLEQPVRFGEVAFTLLPSTVVVRDVRILAPREGDPPLVEVPRVEADLDLRALQGRDVHIRRIRAVRPRITAAFFADGSDNLIHRRRPRRQRRFDVYIDRLEVVEASFLFDHRRIGLSMAADDVEAQLRGSGEMELRGRAAARRVEVELPGGRRRSGMTAAAAILVRRGAVEIEEARLDGTDVAFTVDGACTWRPDKKCQLHARGRTDGRVLDQLGYFRDLRGEVELDGTVLWRPGSLGWRSRVEAPSLVLWQRRLRDARGVLAADRQGIQLAIEQASYAGGTVRGTVAWDRRANDEPVELDLELEGLDLDTVLRDQAIPVSGLDARLGGPFRYRFARRAPRQGDGSAEIALVPGAGEGVALEGAFPLRIESGVVRSASIDASSPAHAILASGGYDLAARRGTFDYQIATRDVPALASLLPLARGAEPPPRWLPSAGRGELEGTLRIAPGGVTSDLRLDLEAVRAPALPRPQPVTGTLRAGRGGIEDLRLEIGGAEEALLLAGDIRFAPPAGTGPGTGDADAPLALTIDAVDWPLAEARPWLPFALPLDGRVSGRLDLDVAGGESRGRLDAVAAPALLEIGGAGELALESLHTRLAWDPEALRFETVEARGAAGAVTGYGTMAFADRRLDLRFASPALRLDAPPLRGYLPRADLGGTLALAVRVGGTPAQPELELEATVASLTLGSRPLPGESRLKVRWDGERLEADGRLLDLVAVTGGGRLVAGGDAEIALEVRGGDVRALLELAGGTPPAALGGDFAGVLRIAGPVNGGGGAQPAVALTLDTLRLSLGARRASNLEPVVVRLRPDGLDVVSLYLGDPASMSELFATGAVAFAGEETLDLLLQSSFDTSWLGLAGVELLAEGSIDVLGRVGGTLLAPYLDGQAALRDGRLPFGEGIPHELDDLHGVVLVDRDGLVLDRLEAAFAGGRLRGSGRARLPRDGTAPTFRIRLSGSDLTLLVPEGWTLEGDADLTIASRAGGAGVTVRGRAALDDALYRADLPIGFAQVLQRVFERQRLEIDAADPTLSRIHLDVAIEVPDGLRVRNNLADLTGGADLTLRGTLARPVLFGTVDFAADSKLVYNGTEYRLERGRLVFANPTRLDPEVDLVATTRIREYDVNLSLSGTLERLDAGFSSEPPLPDLEVFRLLASGEAGDDVTSSVVRDLTGAQDAQSTSAAAFLYGQAASVVGQRVGALFGFDTFRIDPLTGSGDALSRTRITVGKRLSRDLFVTYSADPSSTEDQRLQVEWQVSRNLVLVLTQNGDETYSADARWEQSF